MVGYFLPIATALLDDRLEKGSVSLKQLEGFDEEKFFETAPNKVIDLKTTDYLIEIEPGKRLTTQEALIMAAKREKAPWTFTRN